MQVQTKARAKVSFLFFSILCSCSHLFYSTIYLLYDLVLHCRHCPPYSKQVWTKVWEQSVSVIYFNPSFIQQHNMLAVWPCFTLTLLPQLTILKTSSSKGQGTVSFCRLYNYLVFPATQYACCVTLLYTYFGWHQCQSSKWYENNHFLRLALRLR